MKRIAFGILPIVVSVVLSGCVSHHQTMALYTDEPVTTTRTTRTVVVTQEPPALRTEVEGVPPSTAHVWIAGYWMHDNDRWIWLPGHWEARPTINATWISGHWDKDESGKGWVWTAGHWE